MRHAAICGIAVDSGAADHLQHADGGADPGWGAGAAAAHRHHLGGPPQQGLACTGVVQQCPHPHHHAIIRGTHPHTETSISATRGAAGRRQGRGGQYGPHQPLRPGGRHVLDGYAQAAGVDKGGCTRDYRRQHRRDTPRLPSQSLRRVPRPHSHPVPPPHLPLWAMPGAQASSSLPDRRGREPPNCRFEAEQPSPWFLVEHVAGGHVASQRERAGGTAARVPRRAVHPVLEVSRGGFGH
mmetsp:Transcript_10032/g.24339  ORF Transcript_10032/g.24339 Transcript_10032/m.24339 type:complete len:239 (+) Transcript_10032:270-986(+)